MEVLFILFIIFSTVLVFKLLAFIVQTGIFFITIPLKIIGFIVVLFLILFVFVPVGFFSALAGIFLVPLAILLPFLPVLLLVFLVTLLVRKS